MLLQALAQKRWRHMPRIVVFTDCKAAIQAVEGRGKIGVRVRAMAALRRIREAGASFEVHWIRSHDKPVPRSWRAPWGTTECMARALNARADLAARAEARRRAHGSARAACVVARAAAAKWESAVVRALADTAQELVTESAGKVAADDEGGRASQGSRDHVA